ncbi:MAG: hypothetical protein R2844_06860 [Caldilineales bacterium]
MRVGNHHPGQRDVQRCDVLENPPGRAAVQPSVHQQRPAILHKKAGVGAGPQVIRAIGQLYEVHGERILK